MSKTIHRVYLDLGGLPADALHVRLRMGRDAVAKLIDQLQGALEDSDAIGTDKIMFEILSSDAPLWDLENWESFPDIAWSARTYNQ